MQFMQSDDFSKIYISSLSRMSHPSSGFPGVFHNKEGLLLGYPQNVLHEGEARNREISASQLSEVETILFNTGLQRSKVED